MFNKLDRTHCYYYYKKRRKKCNANTELDVIQKLNLKQKQKNEKREKETMKKVHNIAIYVHRDTWWYKVIKMQNITEVPYENICIWFFVSCFALNDVYKNEKWMAAISVVPPINKKK